MRAGRKQRASLAWSCNNPGHDDRREEHRIELQHCIACSGVVMPPQSDAYATTAKMTTTRRNGLAKPILSRLEAFGGLSQAGCRYLLGTEKRVFPATSFYAEFRSRFASPEDSQLAYLLTTSEA
jgi:hypothetical protein